MDRQQIGVLLILKKLEQLTGRVYDLSNPLDRYIIQRIVYLAQQNGIHLGYYFRWSPF